MKLFNGNKCCCGFSLKTSTVFILWSTAFMGAFSFFSSLSDNLAYFFPDSHSLLTMQMFNIFSALIMVLISVVGIIAIERKVPMMLLPYIWQSVIQLLISAFIMVYVLVNFSEIVNDEVLDKFLKDAGDLKKTDPELINRTKVVLSKIIFNTLLCSWIVLTIFACFTTLVVYAYYKRMVEEKKEIAIIYNTDIGESKQCYPSTMHSDFLFNVPAYPPPYSEHDFVNVNLCSADEKDLSRYSMA